jgi:phenylpropionate dioxygenase-like ring-hydroxylating dioxygenase large terminal subunit
MLEDYWYIVAQEGQVKNKPVSIQLFDRHLVVFKSGDNSYSALEDRCAHRQAPLSSGKLCHNSNIQCPYHGWEYDSTGKLVNIPALSKNDLPNINIPSYHCLVQDGYIWICLSEKPATKTPLRFENIDDSGWLTFRMQTTFNASVESCLENFLDCPHATHVHNTLFRSPAKKRVNTITQMLADGASVKYYNESRNKSFVWWGLQNSKTNMEHTDRFIAPATSKVDYIFSDGKHYRITSSCTPINDSTTDVYTVISFKYGFWGYFIKLFFKPLAHIIIKQDVQILRKQCNNIKKFGEKKFFNSKADLLLPYIIEWREAIANDTKPNIGDFQKQYRDVYL